jgi:hypothetical protein
MSFENHLGMYSKKANGIDTMWTTHTPGQAFDQTRVSCFGILVNYRYNPKNEPLKYLRDVTFGLVLIFTCIDAFPAGNSANVNNMDAVTGVAEEFCSAEMTGEMERRSKIVHLSPRRYAVEKKSRFPYAVGTIVFGHESITVN